MSEELLRDITVSSFNKLRCWLSEERLSALTPRERRRSKEDRKKEKKDLAEAFRRKTFGE